MVVTAIEASSKRKYKVYIDEEFYFFLYPSELRQYHVKEGQPVSEELVDQIFEECILKRAKRKALYMLQKQDYTQYDLEQKLLRADYREDIVDEVILYLKGYHYIDDQRYARQYITYKMSGMSLRQVKQKLLSKGISSEDYESVIAQLQDEGEIDFENNEFELAQRLFEKKMKHFEDVEMDFAAWNKVYQFMARKGFSAGVIRKLKENYEKNKDF